MTGDLSSVPPQSQVLKDRSGVKGRYRSQTWEWRLTPNEVRSQFAFSEIVGPDVTVNGTGHDVCWTNMEGLNGVLGLF